MDREPGILDKLRAGTTIGGRVSQDPHLIPIGVEAGQDPVGREGGGGGGGGVCSRNGCQRGVGLQWVRLDREPTSKTERKQGDAVKPMECVLIVCCDLNYMTETNACVHCLGSAADGHILQGEVPAD